MHYPSDSSPSTATVSESFKSNHPPQARAKHSMTRTQKILFFLTAWLIVLMPFLFWWNTWFGRRLSDQRLNEYLHDQKKPRHIQHALVQIGEGMERQDAAAKRWYPEL